ncbi:MAG: hypothetical protein II319_07960, partial [Clostridia bacterium]|nr:hypothetical protein [Clostridia bacterium]
MKYLKSLLLVTAVAILLTACEPSPPLPEGTLPHTDGTSSVDEVTLSTETAVSEETTTPPVPQTTVLEETTEPTLPEVTGTEGLLYKINDDGKSA